MCNLCCTAISKLFDYQSLINRHEHFVESTLPLKLPGVYKITFHVHILGEDSTNDHKMLSLWSSV